MGTGQPAATAAVIWGDRPGATQHRLAAAGDARRARLRQGDPGTAGADERIFAIGGDVAATDPLRLGLRPGRRDAGALSFGPPSTAALQRPTGRPGGAGVRCSHPARRVGGVRAQRQGVLFPAWSIDRVLMPWIVRRGIYGGTSRRFNTRTPPLQAAHEIAAGRAAGERQQPGLPCRTNPLPTGRTGCRPGLLTSAAAGGGDRRKTGLTQPSSARHTELMGFPGELSGRDPVDAAVARTERGRRPVDHRRSGGDH